MRVLGVNDIILRAIQKNLSAKITVRGSEVRMQGAAAEIAEAESFFRYLSGLSQDTHIDPAVIPALVEQVRNKDTEKSYEVVVEGPIPVAGLRRNVIPRSEGQRKYLKNLATFDLSLAVGPAGTGKTYLAVYTGLGYLLRGDVKRLVLVRPAVEAGERLGFLPGDYKEKVDPYLRPLYDALEHLLGQDRLRRFLENQSIEIAPLAYMRGRTLEDAFIILDEAQNTTTEQMKMFLTRLGLRSQAAVTGDITQIDLPPRTTSGFVDALDRLREIEGISISHLNETDVVRHPLVRKIVRAYAKPDSPSKRGLVVKK